MGCGRLPVENGTDFSITNSTKLTLTIQGYIQVTPTAASTIGPASCNFVIAPGEKDGCRLGLSPAQCRTVGFVATDAAGRIVARKPSPICEDAAGNGNTWTITTAP
jgi:predicted Zn-ribbon and HTH transcriptional regulator